MLETGKNTDDGKKYSLGKNLQFQDWHKLKFIEVLTTDFVFVCSEQY